MGDTTFILEGEDDCLYLNIWSPDISGSYPVMFWIHGGGNQQGSTSQVSGGTEFYHGKNLSERGDVVVVTIQYRLGALGYLVHPGLEHENPFNISGNYGVMDQIFALQWVQNNIPAFGGNPDNVTIFGESGGGVNVGNLMTTPQASGLFHRAIIQSATPVINHYDTARIEGIDFVNDFVSTGSDSAKITHMRTVHADSISMKNSSPLEGGVVQMAWQPVLDDYIFSDMPETVFQSGNFNNVPLIIGSNADEMKPLVDMMPIVFPYMVNALIDSLVPHVFQATAHALYPASNITEARDSYQRMLTDGQFITTSRRTAQCVSLNQTEPVFRYFFSHTHLSSIPLLGSFGSYHGIEIFYVFNTWENSPMAWGPLFSDQDDSVQTNTLKYWTNFAHTGNPNGKGLPNWPVYDAEKDCYLEIQATPDGTHCGLKTAECDLWDNAIGYNTCSSTVNVKNNSSFLNQINVYPNPSKDVLYFSVNKPYKEMIISLFSIVGDKIGTITNQNELIVSFLPPGTYVIKIDIDNFVETHKIIKLE